MKRWHLPTLTPSSDKQHTREPGTDAPRVATVGRSKPRVLFSEPECRAILIDLRTGEEMGDHAVHERAMIEVVSGRIAITCADETVDCEWARLSTSSRASATRSAHSPIRSCFYCSPRGRPGTTTPTVKQIRIICRETRSHDQKTAAGLARPTIPSPPNDRRLSACADGLQPIMQPINPASGFSLGQFQTKKWVCDPIGERARAVQAWSVTLSQRTSQRPHPSTRRCRTQQRPRSASPSVAFAPLPASFRLGMPAVLMAAALGQALAAHVTREHLRAQADTWLADHTRQTQPRSHGASTSSSRPSARSSVEPSFRSPRRSRARVALVHPN